jgi:hypothetical protein
MLEGSCHCGMVRWTFDGAPETATACNCSICRRYGALWAYGLEDVTIRTSGATQAYLWNRNWIEFHFCAKCACIAYWRATRSGADGRRMAVNLRLAPPDAVSRIALIHHDTETKADLPADGRCVADVWF